MKQFKCPLVIVGQLSQEERQQVLPYLLRWNVPVYAEALSGLREHPALMDRLILSGEALLSEAGFESVIRIGGVPTLRFWRDLEHKYRDLPVAVFSRLPFSGMGRSEVTVQPIGVLENIEIRGDEAACKTLLQKDRERYQERLKTNIFYQLSKSIPKGSRIFLGNSLPIREWDLCATREDRGFEMAANRGANGIDGELSTFYGWCEPGKSNWAILGDLTTLYDLAAPWILPQLKDVETNLVVINNGGGQLFFKLFPQEIFLNRHQISFQHWAKMWNLSYVIVNSSPRTLDLGSLTLSPSKGPSTNGHRLIEIQNFL